MKLTLIGCGKIGEALAGGLLRFGEFPDLQLRATTMHEETARSLAERLEIPAGVDNLEAVRGAACVILGLKPLKLPAVCKEIAPHLSPDTLVISLATGVPLSIIEGYFAPQVRVMRAMPNTPIMIGEGMTVLSRGSRTTAEDMALARKLFGSVGETVELDDELMNAATGMSASGPAYIYLIIESLAEAGVKVGLPRELATRLAAQAARGAAGLVLKSGKHPALLKDSVTTPAGVTIDGLMELEGGGVRVAMIKAIVMSTKRADEIQEKVLSKLSSDS